MVNLIRPSRPITYVAGTPRTFQSVFAYRAQLRANVWNWEGRWRPFLVAGGGALSLSMNRQMYVLPDTDPNVHVGAGLEYDLGKSWGARIDARLLFVPSVGQSYFTEEFEKQGIAPEDISLKIGIFGAEPWGEGMRAEIEKKLGIDAIDIYGLTEVMGPGVACECIETKDGPVIWEDHFYPEIIHPETGEVLPDGELGELVFTSLTKEALPVVRYRTRDLARLLPPTTRAFRRMSKITGRSDDMLIIRGVNLFPGHIEELILKQPQLSGHYLLEVYREGPLDQMEVLVEVKPEFAHASGEMKQAAAKGLQHEIKGWLGVTTRVSILDPGHLPRPEGKARRVIDKRTV